MGLHPQRETPVLRRHPSSHVGDRLRPPSTPTGPLGASVAASASNTNEILGALPDHVNERLRKWAWPHVSPAQWRQPWEQLREEGRPPPNLLPLSPWGRHAGTLPFSLNAPPWVDQREPSLLIPKGTRLLWTLLKPVDLASWMATNVWATQLASDAITQMGEVPANAPMNHNPGGPRKHRRTRGVPESDLPGLPNPHRHRLVYLHPPAEDPPRRYWGHSLEDEFHRWRKTGVGSSDYAPGNNGTPARLEHFRSSLRHVPTTGKIPTSPSLEPPHDHWRARRIGEAAHPGPGNRVSDTPALKLPPSLLYRTAQFAGASYPGTLPAASITGARDAPIP